MSWLGLSNLRFRQMNLDKKQSAPRTQMGTKSYFSQLFQPMIDKCVSVSGSIPGSIPMAFMLLGPVQAEGPRWRISTCCQVNWDFGYTGMNLEQLSQSQEQLLPVCATDTRKPGSKTLWIWELQSAVLKAVESNEVVCQPKASRRIPKIQAWFCRKSVRKTDWGGNFAQQGLPERKGILFGETWLYCVDCSTFSYHVLLHKEKRGVCKKG